MRVGTAGWSYPGGAGKWDGIFYPTDRKVDPLQFYAQHFNCVEINSSFYRPIAPYVARSWAAKTPPDFRFTAKLYQKFTHPKMYEETTGYEAELVGADFEKFRAGLHPLGSAGKLGALLAQFPPSFKASEESLALMEQLFRQFREYPLVVELRHRSWTDDPRTASLMEEHGVSWCMIDEPKFKSSIREVPLTGKLGYFRFHGRNWRDWWTGDRETRYNYLYTPEEQQQLAAEVKEVETKVGDAYVFYNNHYGAKAVANALEMRALLGQPVAGQLVPSMLEAFPSLSSLGPVTVQPPPQEEKR